MAGNIYGLSGDDQKAYILDCFQSNEDLTDDLYDAFVAIEAGD